MGAQTPDPWSGNRWAQPSDPRAPASSSPRAEPGSAAGSAPGPSTSSPAGPRGFGERTPGGNERGWDGSGPTAAASATGAPSAPPSTTSAPRAWLWASIALGLLGLLLGAVLGGALAPAVLAWVMAGILGLGTAMLFTVKDARAQLHPFYLHVASTRRLYQGAILVCLLGTVVAAVRIALILGRTW